MRIRSAALAATMISFAAVTMASAAPDYIEKALNDPARSPAAHAADALRKPAESLAASGVKPGDVVADFLPGAGYWTLLLSDIVGPTGKVYALDTDRWGMEDVDKVKAKAALPGHENIKLSIAMFGLFNVPEKLDVFWTAQNYHDLHIAKYGVVDMRTFDKAVYDALKPGGVFLVLDQAAAKGAGLRDVETLHRIDEETVKQEVEAVGFKFESESMVMRDKTDDHTKPIFDLKGHTDQFILKFRKPR